MSLPFPAPQKLASAGAGPGYTQKPGTPAGSLTQVADTQVFGLPSVVSQAD